MLYGCPKGYYMYFKELLEFDFSQVSMKKRLYVLKHYILYSYLTGNNLDLSTVYNLSNKILLLLLYIPGIIKTKMLLKNDKEIAHIYYTNKNAIERNKLKQIEKGNIIKDYIKKGIDDKISKSSKYIVDEETEENIKDMNNLGVNISNVDNVFNTNNDLGIKVIDINNEENNNYSENFDNNKEYETDQKIYNEETRKEVSRSQKLKEKLDELINRSKHRKE